MSSTAAHGHLVPYGTFVKVWLLLLILTATLVVTSLTSHEASVWAMLTLTPLKAGLVFFYFMHLKYERAFFKGLLLLVLVVLIVFLALTFLDISFTG